LVFALPPAEPAAHRAGTRATRSSVLSDLAATVAALEAKGVRLAQPITEQTWGRLTAIALPDGSEIGLYQPTHPRPGTPETRNDPGRVQVGGVTPR
jgi:hypothetical protein